MTGEDDHFVAKANYDFSGTGQEELSFRVGQEIRVAPKGMCYVNSILNIAPYERSRALADSS